MKRTLTYSMLLIAALGCYLPLSGQDTQRDILSLRVLGVDFYSALAWDDNLMGLDYSFDDATDELMAGWEVEYTRGINDYLEVAIPARIGRLSRRADLYFFDDEPDRELFGARETPFFSLDARLNFKYEQSPTAVVVPYLFSGMGAMVVDELDADFNIPAGGGVRFRISNGFYASIQGEYRFAFKEATDYLVYGAGVTFDVNAKEEAPEPEVQAPLDSDNDGIADNVDACPQTAGLASLQGCPDSDEDGIADKDDACPDVAGVMAFNGCPDSDGDGIQDSEDECPQEAGVAALNGCPMRDADGDGVMDPEDDCPNTPGLVRFNGCPDTDGDGIKDDDDACPDKAGLTAFQGCPDTDGDNVPDKDDRCPADAGPASNRGCPVIKEEDKETLEFAAQNLEFNTGRATLRPASMAIMDQIVDIMRRYPNRSLRIGGHTDSVGSEATNQKLSEDRAKTAYDYLIAKGVDPARLSYAGYGESRPIADNKTAAGRQQNRRVEFDLYLK